MCGAGTIHCFCLVKKTGALQRCSVRGSGHIEEWRVDEVTDFLNNQDLRGPASVLNANGVNGHDLVNATFQELTSAVRLTPFAARKVLSARDAALAK